MADYEDPENTILMDTTKGLVVIKLMPDVAPLHCARMKLLAKEGAYDTVIFHRVMEGFMAQTGDVEFGKAEGEEIRKAGRGGSTHGNLKAEFSKVPHARGSVGAARAQNPDSANSQFFINFTDNDFLNGQYTVYGQVIEGMEAVDELARGEPPANPDMIVSMKLAADT